jgi:hypothetical protein
MFLSSFYGRTQELDTLTQWIVQDQCRLVAILGMGGIRKEWKWFYSKTTHKELREKS